MYISSRFEKNICATMHLRALKKCVGTKNVTVVNLRPLHNVKNSVNLGKFSKKEKIQRFFELNTWYLSNNRIRYICNLININNIHIVFIDDSFYGKLAKAIKRKHPNVFIISFYHDIGRALYRQWLKDKGISFLHQFCAGIYGEYLTQKYSDCNLVLNKRDYNLFEKYYKKAPSSLLPMSVDSPDLCYRETKEYLFNKETHHIYILFVATYYKPNIVGLEWFVKNVFSLLPNYYRLLVVGRNMDKLTIQYKGIENMEIIGEVETLSCYYNNTDIVVAPIFEGGGMKQKTAEAFAYGIPFVGTTESLYGYEKAIDIKSENNNPIVFKADTAKEFLDSFNYIERNKIYGYHEELNTFYEANHSLQSTITVLTTILNKCL